MIPKFYFYFLAVCLVVGCNNPSQMETEASKILEKFDTKFNQDCEYDFFSIQKTNNGLYQIVKSKQKSSFRQCFNAFRKNENIGLRLGGWNTIPQSDVVNAFREYAISLDEKFDSFIGENENYLFSLQLNSSVDDDDPATILDREFSLDKVKDSLNLCLGNLLSGIRGAEPIGKCFGKTYHVVSLTSSTNPEFQNCSTIEVLELSDVHGITSTLYVDIKSGNLISVEKRSTENAVISKIRNFYRTLDGKLIPDYQLVFSEDQANKLALSRCLVFLNFKNETDLDEQYCFMSKFGFPEPVDYANSKGSWMTGVVMATVLFAIAAGCGWMIKSYRTRAN